MRAIFIKREWNRIKKKYWNAPPAVKTSFCETYPPVTEVCQRCLRPRHPGPLFQTLYLESTPILVLPQVSPKARSLWGQGGATPHCHPALRQFQDRCLPACMPQSPPRPVCPPEGRPRRSTAGAWTSRPGVHVCEPCATWEPGPGGKSLSTVPSSPTGTKVCTWSVCARGRVCTGACVCMSMHVPINKHVHM